MLLKDGNSVITCISKTVNRMHRLHAVTNDLGNKSTHVHVTSAEDCLLKKSNKHSERSHLRI